MKESVEEFIARGGRVSKHDNGSETTCTASQLIKKDKRLAALRKLLVEVENEDAYTKVQSAIDARYDILKGL